MNLPRYDRRQTYQWNYDNAPDVVDCAEPPVAGKWTFCGIPVRSPLGVAAGPLLNGKWCLYYAALGFDVVTYKTVRSCHCPCYDLPNLLPVQCDQLHGGETNIPAAGDFSGSWAVSFGMPSQAPQTWQADVAETRRRLPAHKLLSVSVVGTMKSGWTIEELADDYALCARGAAEHGADLVEFNLSCPNVSTCDGQLYQNARDAALVADRVREVVGNRPTVAKLGHFQNADQMASLLESLAGRVAAVATTNSVAATVSDPKGRPYFNGEPRGICGRGILDASVRQTEAIARYAAHRGLPISVISVGGAATAADVNRYLAAGAEAVHLATSAMVDPKVALRIRGHGSTLQNVQSI